ncbi:MAG: SpoIID/LytB domain-containing protein [Candidatus Dormibacteria bacterium]
MVQPAAADSAADQLQRLRAEEASQRSQLDQIGSQQQGVLASLSRLREDLNAKRSDLAGAFAQVADLKAAVAGLEAREKSAEERHDQRVRAYLDATRVTYKRGASADWIVYLVNSGTFSEFLDRLTYVMAFSRNDLAQARAMRDERDRLAAQRRRSEELKAQLDPLLASLAARLSDAEAAVSGEATVASDLERQQRAALGALQGLQHREKELEAALAAAQAVSEAAAAKGGARTFASQCPAAPAGMVSFCGHGFGHGVGLGQYGALGMAQAGIPWQNIVAHFYSGTSLSGFPAQTVRVLLTRAGGTLTPRFAGAAVYDPGGAVVGHAPAEVAVVFSRGGDGNIRCSVCGAASAAWMRLQPDPGGLFAVSGSGGSYRGDAVVDGSSGLQVINHVDLEDYLRGLGEVPSSWPLNAVAAQSVAARTYALAHLRSDGLYDMDDTTRFQVYRGYAGESATQNLAVARTAGQALFYGGQLIDAVFSSSDGGHSECASAEWGAGDTPCSPLYLQGVLDNYDSPAGPSNPYHTWYTPAHRLSDIQGYLVAGHVYNSTTCGVLDRFTYTRDRSNRVRQVQMVGDRGTCNAPASAFISGINAGSPSDFVVYGEMFGDTPGSGAWPYF